MTARPTEASQAVAGDQRAASGERFASHVARLLADSLCEDVLVLDVHAISSITDFFVIATGASERQLRSVAADIKLLAREEGEQAYAHEASGSAGWFVADFVDVVVHLFEPQTRAYYDLESLWADGRRVDWHSATRPGQFAHLRARATQ